MSPASIHAKASLRGSVLRFGAVFIALACLLLPSPALGQWTHFKMKRHDGKGNYLWSYPENWHRGVPNSGTSCEIGDDSSGRAMHCVIRSDAVCRGMELAEHGRTEGSTLRLEKGASLTFTTGAVMSKDRESWFYVDGTAKSLTPNHTFRVGGPWGRPESGLPSSAHILIGPTGVLETWFIGINTSHRVEAAPSSPWGPKFFSGATDSEIVVNGGRLVAREGLRITTTDARRPGALRLRGRAKFTTNTDAKYGIDVWCGIWEIDGGKADIRVGDIEFWGNKFRDAVNSKTKRRVGSGLSVLKLTGDGISTIRARKLNFIDAAVLDASELKVPPGTYTIIDGKSLAGTNLRLAAGTDAGKWSFRFDPATSDLLLSRAEEPSEERYDKMTNVSTGKHPYLFFRADDLPRIRQRTSKMPGSFFLSHLRKSADRLTPEKLAADGRPPTYADRVQGRAMNAAALSGLITGNRKHTLAAKQALVNLSKWKDMGKTYGMAHGGMIRMAAIGYDWVYNELSEDERKEVERFIADGAGELVRQGKTGWWGAGKEGRQGNWQPQMYSAVAITGMVLKGKHPDAEKWIRLGADVIKEDLDYELDSEGGVYEAYVRYGLGVMMGSIYPTAEALRRVTGEDLYKYRDSVLYKSTAFTAYMLYPQRTGMPPLGDTHDGLYSVGLQLARNASEYGDGLAAWYLDRLIREGWTPGNDHAIWGTLWAMPVKPEHPDSSPRLSKAHAYNSRGKGKWDFGTGHVFLRTDFGSKDGIQFACQAGGDGGFHGHSDKGSYLINAYGVRFLRDFFDGSYQGDRFTWHHSGEAHNVVLIDGAGQGAQCVGIDDPQYYSKIADVEAIESGKGYDYVRMNLTKAYQASPRNKDARKAMRHVVFVRTTAKTGYFVVIDDVEKDDQEHTFSHPFHYDKRDVQVESIEGGRFALKGRGATMIVEAVHPPSGFRAEKARKYGDDYVMLTAKDKAKRFVMVTILYPFTRNMSVPEWKSAERDGKVSLSVEGTEILYDLSSEKVSVKIAAK